MCGEYNDGSSPQEIEFNTRRCRPYEQKDYKGHSTMRIGEKVWISRDGLMYNVEIVGIASQLEKAVNKIIKIPTYSVQYAQRGSGAGFGIESNVLEWDLFDERSMPIKDIIYCVDWNDNTMKKFTKAQKAKVVKEGLLVTSKERRQELQEQLQTSLILVKTEPSLSSDGTGENQASRSGSKRSRDDSEHEPTKSKKSKAKAAAKKRVGRR